MTEYKQIGEQVTRSSDGDLPHRNARCNGGPAKDVDHVEHDALVPLSVLGRMEEGER